MSTRRIRRAVTGLAAGAVATAALIGVFILGSLVGIPSVPFSVFEWLVRVLPGRLVIFGLELTLRVLEGLGFNIKNTAKTAEEVLAISALFVAGWLAGLLFFSLVGSPDPQRVRRYGRIVGTAVGLFSLVIVLIQTPPSTAVAGIGDAIWVLGAFLLWGWGLARLYMLAVPPAPARAPAAGTPLPGTQAPLAPPAVASAAATPPAEVSRISRRRFVVEIGGLAATIVVLGAELADVLRVEGGPAVPALVRAPIPFPNADSPVRPVSGTRPEYTAVPDFYRVDIDLTPPQIDGTSWRLRISGLVEHPVSLTLDQLKTAFRPRNRFATLSCISNPVGGPLIGTTLWTGPSFSDVLAASTPLPSARFAHLLSQDGFDEVVDLAMIEGDPRILLVHTWNGQPLPAEHGFPLRVYVPDVHGMKQPKWITDIVLVADFIQGYWVKRGWDTKAQMKTTSVMDTVATDALVMRGGRTYVPVGGIAHAGDRGISRVELQVDNGPWEEAEIRAPLSGLTWVIWRYEWPFDQGDHVFSVRAYDGSGQLQITQEEPTFPSGASGIDHMSATVLPLKL